MTNAEDIEIAASKLGTKDYWDTRYETELNNYVEYGDEGEVWFGKMAENRIVKYLTSSKVDKTIPILDLGCGNGSILRRLRKIGYLSLAGVDYCQSAVDLATKLTMEDSTDIGISYEVFDILSPTKGRLLNQYKIVLDKGTWDAMSLSEDRDIRRVAYVTSVLSALTNDGTGEFIIFSCNFTRDELCTQFESQDLVFYCEIEANHSISFGGRQGVTSTGVVFRKIN